MTSGAPHCRSMCVGRTHRRTKQPLMASRRSWCSGRAQQGERWVPWGVDRRARCPVRAPAARGPGIRHGIRRTRKNAPKEQGRSTAAAEASAAVRTDDRSHRTRPRNSRSKPSDPGALAPSGRPQYRPRRKRDAIPLIPEVAEEISVCPHLIHDRRLTNRLGVTFHACAPRYDRGR